MLLWLGHSSYFIMFVLDRYVMEPMDASVRYVAYICYRYVCVDYVMLSMLPTKDRISTGVYVYTALY
jgi:hypothetical protein